MRYAIQNITRENGEVVFLYNWSIDSETQRETLSLLLEANPAYISKVQDRCPSGMAKLVVTEDQKAVDFLRYFLDYEVVSPDVARDALDWLEQSLRSKRLSAKQQRQNLDCERED